MTVEKTSSSLSSTATTERSLTVEGMNSTSTAPPTLGQFTVGSRGGGELDGGHWGRGGERRRQALDGGWRRRLGAVRGGAHAAAAPMAMGEWRAVTTSLRGHRPPRQRPAVDLPSPCKLERRRLSASCCACSPPPRGCCSSSPHGCCSLRMPEPPHLAAAARAPPGCRLTGVPSHARHRLAHACTSAAASRSRVVWMFIGTTTLGGEERDSTHIHSLRVEW